jgi:hypothetical protein
VFPVRYGQTYNVELSFKSSKLYAHKNVCKPKLVNVVDNKAAAQIGTNVRACEFNAGLLARSQFASGRSCDRPTRLRFSLVPEQMLSWYPNSTLYCMLHMQPSAIVIENGEVKMTFINTAFFFLCLIRFQVFSSGQ